MVRDAELNAEEDKKLHELVTARNQLDSLIHSVKKSLSEYGDKITADDKTKVEAALKEAEEVVKSDDKEVIEAKSEALMQASHKLAEHMYAEKGAAEGAAGAEHAHAEPGKKGDDGNVVDAEFTEVKDK